jgi:plastocyanin
MQKVEGNVHFHTAMSTAFPQPAPGIAPSPGPLTVAPGRLRSLLGLSTVTYHQGHHSLAIVDSALGKAEGGDAAGVAATAAHPATPAVIGDATVVRIDNFSFTPPELHLRPGEKVLWLNADDVPHVIASADGRFPSSKPLDTDEHYTLTLPTPGTYPYFCSIHPKMTGRIVVG